MPNTIDNSDITLIGIDGVGNDKSILKALKYSKQFFPNATVKFLTSGEHSEIDPDIQHVKINYLNYDDFSVFCLKEMYNFIDTKYMINCHGDGFVVNPDKWTDEFLNYDYIGAPWPRYNLAYSCQRWPMVKQSYENSKGEYRIGNGGFSLRTKKLMQTVSSLYIDEYFKIPEDLVICVILRKKLEEMGFNFVKNILLAGSFSCEARQVDGYILSSDHSLGFHCGETHPDKVKLLELL